MVDQNGDESCSESSEDDGTQVGQLIYMSVYLGPSIGHKDLRGLTTDDPAALARKFAKGHKIFSVQIQLQIKEMIKKKIREYS